MTAPVRLTLSRRAGFDLQALSRATNGLQAVSVARPSMWGNPWAIGEPGIPDAKEAVRRFRCAVIGPVLDGRQCQPNAHPESTIGRLISHSGALLRGKNLACWCKPGEPCHADVLLEIANRPICEAASPGMAKGGAA